MFISVEDGFQYLKVKDAGYTELTAEIVGMTDPYKIKTIGDGITPHKNRKTQEEGIIEKLVREKFLRNKKLRDRFLEDTHEEYYEMTSDKRWGTGMHITHDTKLFDKKQLVGQNKLSEIFVKIKCE